MDTPSLADVVRLLKEEAPRLREAGVLSLRYGAVEVTLAPALGEMPKDFADDEDDSPKNAFDDPATYGLPPGAEAPGFTRPGGRSDREPDE